MATAKDRKPVHIPTDMLSVLESYKASLILENNDDSKMYTQTIVEEAIRNYEPIVKYAKKAGLTLKLSGGEKE